MPAVQHTRRNAIKNIAKAAVFLPATVGFGLTNAALQTPSVPSTPQSIAERISSARMLGQSRLVVLGFKIYDARLWVDSSFSVDRYERESFALELNYLRSFSGSMIAERSLKEMLRIAGEGAISEEKSKRWLDEMKRTFPEVKKGDQLIGLHAEDGSASFLLNGKPIGQIKETEFTRLFFGIWLSSKTSEPKMRRELIAGSMAANTGAAR